MTTTTTTTVPSKNKLIFYLRISQLSTSADCAYGSKNVLRLNINDSVPFHSKISHRLASTTQNLVISRCCLMERTVTKYPDL